MIAHRPVSDRSRDSAGGNLIYATLDFALAAFFLLWTRVIVAWSYGEMSGIEKVPEAETGRQSEDPEGLSDM